MIEYHKTALEYIYDKAVTKAKEYAEDDCPHSCGEWIDIAMDADHIIRKHKEMEQEDEEENK